MRYLLYLVPLLGATGIAVYLALFITRRRVAPGAPALFILMLASAGWSAGYVFELASADLASKLFWAKLEYLGIVMAPVAWFVFAIQYTDRVRWLSRNRRNLTLLLIVPAITLALVWTNNAHGLIWSQTRLDSSGPLVLLDVDYGLWFWIHSAYSYFLLVVGSIWFVNMLRRSSHLYRWQAAVALLGMLMPWLANALFISRLGPLPGLDLTPFAFMFSGLAYAFSLLRFQLLEIVPIARREVVDGLADGVIVLDRQNRIVDLNPAARRLAGLNGDDVIGHPLAQVMKALAGPVIHSQDLCTTQIEMVLNGESPQQHYELQISRLTNRREQEVGWLVVLHDISARKQVEAELQHAKDELELRVAERTENLRQANEQLQNELSKRTKAEAALRNLARRLESIREEEKTRIARSVHDELGQMLTALKMDIVWLSKRLPEDNLQAQKKAETITELISTTIRSVQRIASELRPGLLDNLGLVAAMEWQLQEFRERTDIDFQLEADDEAALKLHPNLTTTLFRIFQEILTNVVRHAEATSVHTTLAQYDQRIRLVVRDNGKGITPGQISDYKSLGLIGIRERLRPWSGDLKIEGSPGAGTSVCVTVPLDPDQRSDT